MTYDWNQSFESYPPGSYRGNTMGDGLRRTKGAFYERYIVEHDIAESASPTVLHRLGRCSIVRRFGSGDPVVSSYVEGALGSRGQTLYWDSGSAMAMAYVLVHGTLTGLLQDDHPQYVKVAGDSVNSPTVVHLLQNLSDDPDDFTVADPLRVMSIGAHLATPGGYSSHPNLIIEAHHIDSWGTHAGVCLNNGNYEMYIQHSLGLTAGNSHELPDQVRTSMYDPDTGGYYDYLPIMSAPRIHAHTGGAGGVTIRNSFWRPAGTQYYFFYYSEDFDGSVRWRWVRQ